MRCRSGARAITTSADNSGVPARLAAGKDERSRGLVRVPMKEPPAAARVFVGPPTLASWTAVPVHGHERLSDRVEGGRETAEPSESHGGGGHEMNPRHPAGVSSIECEESRKPMPRPELGAARRYRYLWPRRPSGTGGRRLGRARLAPGRALSHGLMDVSSSFLSASPTRGYSARKVMRGKGLRHLCARGASGSVTARAFFHFPSPTLNSTKTVTCVTTLLHSSLARKWLAWKSGLGKKLT